MHYLLSLSPYERGAGERGRERLCSTQEPHTKRLSSYLRSKGSERVGEQDNAESLKQTKYRKCSLLYESAEKHQNLSVKIRCHRFFRKVPITIFLDFFHNTSLPECRMKIWDSSSDQDLRISKLYRLGTSKLYLKLTGALNMTPCETGTDSQL